MAHTGEKIHSGEKIHTGEKIHSGGKPGQEREHSSGRARGRIHLKAYTWRQFEDTQWRKARPNYEPEQGDA